MVDGYLKGVYDTDRQSPDFPAIQKQLWETLSKGKPTLWLRTKRLAAIPLAFVLQRRLRSKRIKR